MITLKRIASSAFCLLITLGTFAQQTSKYIVVDQFGYLPDMPKVAVIRNPEIGFDAEETFSPGKKYALVDANTKKNVYEAEPTAWKNELIDENSGDQIWHFDFSKVKKKGAYYILDIEKQVRSFEFEISESVYKEVLKQAFRTFFYQRSGFAKLPPYACEEWSDQASHLGPLQDANCRLFSAKDDASTERDLRGGWYDAGDFNKYTNWNASYIIEMMEMYKEKPSVWSDDFNIPESGNGIPDLLDEAKWGLDHLLRMQEKDGGVLCIVGSEPASPPSSAKGQSLYGPATTSASLSCAGAFAIASTIYRSIGMTEYAEQLKNAAIKAWKWAEANPNVFFKNNNSEYHSEGLAAGQQEIDDYGRLKAKLKASCFLFEATTDSQYQSFFDNNFSNIEMISKSMTSPFEDEIQRVLLYYTSLDGATPAVSKKITKMYKTSLLNDPNNYKTFEDRTDPYFAYLKDYTWGSNGIKCRQGLMYCDLYSYQMISNKDKRFRNAAVSYLSYIHGLNPLNEVFLSNMSNFGAENSVKEFYHSWFCNGSEKWDRVGESTYGPAPGFLTGGCNPSYHWESCCPDHCPNSIANEMCTAESIIPPMNQPNLKSYKDFNTSWPLNSWEITENSCGYQLPYIHLLSKFIK